MMSVSKFPLQFEHLEDRNAPGGILDGFTPLALWGTDLPLFDPLPASSVRVLPAAEGVTTTPVLTPPVDLTGPTALKIPVTEPGAALAAPLGDPMLARTVAAVTSQGHGTIQGPGAIRPGFDENELETCDDCRTISAQELGFAFTLGATTFDRVYVYSNGIVSSLSAISPARVGSTEPLDTFGPETGVILAGFWADVDLRGAGAVRWGVGEVDGYAAWAVTWDGVGHYNAQTEQLNTFQIVLIDFSADFSFYRIEYNYGSIQWQVGDFRPDLAPRVGFTDGKGTAAEVAGSGKMDTLTDDNPDTGLINYDDGYAAGASKVPGRHQIDFFI